MRSDWREPINLGSDRMVTIDELIAMIADSAGKRIPTRTGWRERTGALNVICARAIGGRLPRSRELGVPEIQEVLPFLQAGAQHSVQPERTTSCSKFRGLPEE